MWKQPKNIDPDKVLSFFSIRHNGFSDGVFSSLNLGMKGGDDHKSVLANRKKLASSLKIGLDQMVFANQCHSSKVFVVDKSEAGKGAYDTDSVRGASDALITNQRGLCLLVLTADCAPILLYSPQKQAIAVIHAGRAGIVSNILSNTVDRLQSEFDCAVGDIVAWIGPTISAKNYPITAEAEQEIRLSNGLVTKALEKVSGQTCFNLNKAIDFQLQQKGFRSVNITHSNICTYTNPEILFSERRDGKPTGRFATGIMLN